ncbi:hypothetical protein CO038_00510 [Candidatus Pacearchaeota archaeon CG_4_9_14_0_2_um_filter_39_13]|nr:thioredoxin family protein [Candidatus Pacearchaeota archaeon]OIO42970.1 MAG: hypothetical protein AUJ64_03295 [Candidatus Pacearchaeota archaeon CG1_02_39_14]PJC45038.1 MAG: hypothetical protein CO038_00510 [Candidatus Pacearchaeota archaeon CG_4_9_14_0_2_um_filter_39_13]
MNSRAYLSGLAALTLGVVGCAGSQEGLPDRVLQEDFRELRLEPDSLGGLPISVEGADPRYTGEVVGLNQDNFYEFVEKGNKVVLAYAGWDRNSQKMYPILEKVASENLSVGFGLVDKESNENFWRQEFVKNRAKEGKRIVVFVPSLIFYRDGKEVKLLPGYIDYSKFNSELREHYRKK